MFKRKIAPGKGTGQRLAPGYWKVPGMLILLLSLSVISGCDSIPITTATTPTPLPTKSQPTVIAQHFHATVQTFDKDFTITLDITPNRSGPNAFMAHVKDNRANKPAIHAHITLYTTMQDMAMGTDSIVLHSDGNGQFSATSNVLSMGGDWAIGITIQTPDHVIHKAGVNLIMPL